MFVHQQIKKLHNNMERIALYAGSFNPFTIGHKDIVDRALKIFDKVIIAISINPDKNSDVSTSESKLVISTLYKDNPNVEVIVNTGITYECAKEYNCCALIRGIRNGNDLTDEITISTVNREYGDIETVLIPCRPELMYISSSLIRNLSKSNIDVKKIFT